jgi:NtrC-family two-component system response regulator AlgB
MTAHGTVESAIAATRLGVLEYLQKPLGTEAIHRILSHVQQLTSLERSARAELSHATSIEPLLESQSAAMRAALALADTVAGTDATVLLRGESGTGKGVLARAIHRASRRSRSTFGVVNCPSLSEELLNSELFGHIRGAFTGAVQSNQGMIAFTEGGSLFLDEIGDLPLALQPKLLRFLQDREYQRVGEARTHMADVRVIAATNAPLERRLHKGEFREDLYHRLNVFPIDIPPLRERREDIPRLAHLFLAAYRARHGRNIAGISTSAMQLLTSQPWPGNVRELQNSIERAVILARGEELDVRDLSLKAPPGQTAEVEISDLPSLEEMEKRYISHVLDVADTIEGAAEILDISPPTLWRRRRKYGL